MKKISLILMAVVIVLSSFAFAKAVKQSRLDTQVWTLNAGADPSVASNYTAGASGTCGGSLYICQITAASDPNNSDQPDLSSGSPSANPEAYSATKRNTK